MGGWGDDELYGIYDAANRLTSMTYPGPTVTYNYDPGRQSNL